MEWGSTILDMRFEYIIPNPGNGVIGEINMLRIFNPAGEITMVGWTLWLRIFNPARREFGCSEIDIVYEHVIRPGEL